jgi:hypothetical protein
MNVVMVASSAAFVVRAREIGQSPGVAASRRTASLSASIAPTAGSGDVPGTVKKCFAGGFSLSQAAALPENTARTRLQARPTNI